LTIGVRLLLNLISEFSCYSTNIKTGFIDYALSEEFILEEEFEKTMSRGALQKGDVLFTTEAPLGEVANVDRLDVAIAQRVIKFRAKKGLLDNYFLKYWIMSAPFQQDLFTYSTGSTALGIKSSKLNHLKLVIAPHNEQLIIANYLDEKQTNSIPSLQQTKTD